MSNFNFDDWKDKKVVMHCKTREEAEDFCRVMYEAGKGWISGRSYTKENHWDFYKENMVYYFNEGVYGSIKCVISEYTILEWSDYMDKKPFTKADLKNGDVIVKRNGSVEIVCRETGTLITQTGFNRFNNIKEDLTNLLNIKFENDLDIIDVFRPKEPWQCQFNPEYYTKGDHVYHREEPPIEITLDEIAKLKGVPVERIKIIK